MTLVSKMSRDDHRKIITYIIDDVTIKPITF